MRESTGGVGRPALRRWRRNRWALGVGLVLLLAGCGGSSDDESIADPAGAVADDVLTDAPPTDTDPATPDPTAVPAADPDQDPEADPAEAPDEVADGQTTGDILLYAPAPSQLSMGVDANDKAFTFASLGQPCQALELQSERGRVIEEGRNQLTLGLFSPDDMDQFNAALDADCDELEIRPNSYPITSVESLDIGDRSVRYTFESPSGPALYLLVVVDDTVLASSAEGPQASEILDAVVANLNRKAWAELFVNAVVDPLNTVLNPESASAFAQRLQQDSPELFVGIARYVLFSDADISGSNLDLVWTAQMVSFSCEPGGLEFAIDGFSDAESLAKIASYSRLLAALAASDPDLCPTSGVTPTTALVMLEAADPPAAELFASQG